MNIFNDNRVVMTLDAGGTNFVFGAMQGGKEIIEPVSMPSNAHDLDKCLDGLIAGFESVKDKLDAAPVAISFAFPGPADYNNGIIGDLGNLPAFRGGIALGPMLSDKFGIPVFIKNDGDLYAYGEALGGILHDINEDLAAKGSSKRYHNLVGLTLGTGFGAGIVHDGLLLGGDNSIPAEIWNTSNSVSPQRNSEEGVSTRAIICAYEREVGLTESGLMPYDIAQIALGKKDGNQDAAKLAFEEFGTHIGDAVCNLIMLFDANIVIGGGLTGAAELYMPAVMKVVRGTFADGQERLVHKVYNIDDAAAKADFVDIKPISVKVPGSERSVEYFSEPRVAIATSKVGGSKAIAMGAYAFALSQLDKR